MLLLIIYFKNPCKKEREKIEIKDGDLLIRFGYYIKSYLLKQVLPTGMWTVLIFYYIL